MRLAVHLTPDHPIRRHPLFSALVERGELVDWPSHTWSGSAGLGESDVHGFLVGADGVREAARLASRLQTQGAPWVMLLGDPREPAIWGSPDLPTAERADDALLSLIQGAQARACEPAPPSADEAWLLGASVGAQRLRHDFEARAAEGPGDLLILGAPQAGAAALARALHRRWTRDRRPLVARDASAAAAPGGQDLLIEWPGDGQEIAEPGPCAGLRLWLARTEPAEAPGLRDLRRLELPALAERRADLPEIGAALLERLPGPAPRSFAGGALEADAWFALAQSGPLELALTLLRQGVATGSELPRPTPGAVQGSSNVERPAAALPRTEAPSQGSVSLTVDLEDCRLETLERRLIEHVLTECSGNKSQAAGLLGLHRQTLYNKIERHGL